MRSTGARLALFAVLLALPACSWLVDGDPEPIGCSSEGHVGEPSCDDGFMCRSGACVPCGACLGEAGASGRR